KACEGLSTKGGDQVGVSFSQEIVHYKGASSSAHKGKEGKIIPLEQKNAHMNKELKVSMEVYSLLGHEKEKEKKKMEDDVNMKQLEIMDLGFKVQELEKLRDDTSTIIETPRDDEAAGNGLEAEAAHDGEGATPIVQAAPTPTDS
ncbi:hypothetical protein U1Q18_014916, partial [Sarracenia purpurea var. burkii]